MCLYLCFCGFVYMSCMFFVYSYHLLVPQHVSERWPYRHPKSLPRIQDVSDTNHLHVLNLHQQQQHHHHYLSIAKLLWRCQDGEKKCLNPKMTSKAEEGQNSQLKSWGYIFFWECASFFSSCLETLLCVNRWILLLKTLSGSQVVPGLALAALSRWPGTEPWMRCLRVRVVPGSWDHINSMYMYMILIYWLLDWIKDDYYY